MIRALTRDHVERKGRKGRSEILSFFASFAASLKPHAGAGTFTFTSPCRCSNIASSVNSIGHSAQELMENR
jgi:hypothetical protein